MIRNGTRYEGESHEQWRIDQVLSRFGWDGTGRRRGTWIDIKCPFHHDRNASAGYNEVRNIFSCQACEAKGNSVTLVMQQLHLSANEAVQWLHRHITIGGAVGGTQVVGQQAWSQGSNWSQR